MGEHDGNENHDEIYRAIAGATFGESTVLLNLPDISTRLTVSDFRWRVFAKWFRFGLY